jgi:hypothetical protein
VLAAHRDQVIARLTAGRGLERATDHLRRRLTLLGSIEEQNNTQVRQAPVVTASVPGQAQCP